MRLLRDSRFFAVAFAHFGIDVLNGQKAILLAFLAPSLGLSNSDIGLIFTIYLLLGSLTQPIFGLLADRFGPRWIGSGGLFWMIGWFAAAMLQTGQSTLIFLVVGVLGSAAFHPVGTERATARGRALLAGRAATASAIFFLFGRGGLAVGPLIGGVLLDRLGLVGILLLCALVVPIAVNLFLQLSTTRKGSDRQAPAAQPEELAPDPPTLKRGRWVFAAFTLMTLMWAMAEQPSVTFIPKLLSDRGFTPAAYGVVAALFTTGAAVGSFAGGLMADRWGRWRTIQATLAAAVLPLFFYPISEGALLVVFVPLAGVLLGASHSIIVVIAQALLPNRMAFASGLTLGFMFSSGSFGAFLFGLLGDIYPLASVLQLSSALAFGALILSLLLGRKQKRIVASTAPIK